MCDHTKVYLKFLMSRYEIIKKVIKNENKTPLCFSNELWGVKFSKAFFMQTRVFGREWERVGCNEEEKINPRAMNASPQRIQEFINKLKKIQKVLN